MPLRLVARQRTLDPLTEVRILEGQPHVSADGRGLWRGDVAKWQGRGLQNLDHGFESRRRLHNPRAHGSRTLDAILDAVEDEARA